MANGAFDYWIDPYGQEFAVDNQQHSQWMQNHFQMGSTQAHVAGWISIGNNGNVLSVSYNDSKLPSALTIKKAVEITKDFCETRKFNSSAMYIIGSNYYNKFSEAVGAMTNLIQRSKSQKI